MKHKAFLRLPLESHSVKWQNTCVENMRIKCCIKNAFIPYLVLHLLQLALKPLSWKLSLNILPPNALELNHNQQFTHCSMRNSPFLNKKRFRPIPSDFIKDLYLGLLSYRLVFCIQFQFQIQFAVAEIYSHFPRSFAFANAFVCHLPTFTSLQICMISAVESHRSKIL